MRSRNSVKARRICFDTHSYTNLLGRKVMDCHICKQMFDPAREQWEADHIKRWSEGGEDTADNLWPLCADCASIKNPEDTSAVAKGKRWRDKTYNIERKREWR